MGRVGVAPTVYLVYLIYSQGPSLLGIPAHKKTACVEILQTDGLQPVVSLDEAYSCHCFTGVFSHAKPTLPSDRRYRYRTYELDKTFVCFIVENLSFRKNLI